MDAALLSLVAHSALRLVLIIPRLCVLPRRSPGRDRVVVGARLRAWVYGRRQGADASEEHCGGGEDESGLVRGTSGGSGIDGARRCMRQVSRCSTYVRARVAAGTPANAPPPPSPDSPPASLCCPARLPLCVCGGLMPCSALSCAVERRCDPKWHKEGAPQRGRGTRAPGNRRNGTAVALL